MGYTNTEINELQKIENGVYRKILGGRRNSPICVLRGEIGSSMMKTRFIEGILIYTRSIITEHNSLVQEILGITRNEDKGKLQNQRKVTWKHQLTEYLKEANIRYGELKELKKEDIKKRFKGKIKDDGCFDNKFSSILLFRARSNTLKLNTENRHRNGNTKCDLCGDEKEDLIHFLLDCKELERKRDEGII